MKSQKKLSIDVLGKFTMNTNSSKDILNIEVILAPTCWSFEKKGFEQDPQFDRESGQILIFEKKICL
jgi:hypothetical protein